MSNCFLWQLPTKDSGITGIILTTLSGLTCYEDNGLNCWNCKPAPNYMVPFITVVVVTMSLHSKEPKLRQVLRPAGSWSPTPSPWGFRVPWPPLEPESEVGWSLTFHPPHQADLVVPKAKKNTKGDPVFVYSAATDLHRYRGIGLPETAPRVLTFLEVYLLQGPLKCHASSSDHVATHRWQD